MELVMWASMGQVGVYLPAEIFLGEPFKPPFAEGRLGADSAAFGEKNILGTPPRRPMAGRGDACAASSSISAASSDWSAERLAVRDVYIIKYIGSMG